MKTKYTLIAFCFAPMAALASPPEEGCPVSSDEKITCEFIMCNPLGMMSDDSRSECEKVNHRYAIYLSTLGPFEKPAKCWERDQYCNRTIRAEFGQINSMFCEKLQSQEEQDACSSGLEAASGPD